MKTNYANNPPVGNGKYDAIFSLLTPDGDGIVIPPHLVRPIESRAYELRKLGIIFFVARRKNGEGFLERLSKPHTRGNYQLHEKILNLKVGDEPLLIQQSEFNAASKYAIAHNVAGKVKYKTSGRKLEFGKIWRVK